MIEHNKAIVKKLWLEYEPYIKKLCKYKLKNNPDIVDDCVQEVFLDLFEALNGGKTIEYPKAWLSKVANNKIIDIQKNNKKEKDNIISLTDILANTISDHSVELCDEPELSDEQLLWAKNDFLSSLTEEEKTLFKERFVLNKHSKEIALLYNTTESNVRKKVYRLRVKAKLFTRQYINEIDAQKKR
ncbi:MAG: sigma-70 family RNA polymerase sigma factor [Clostridia bacterium]|nr:sigma-70 family RNA polymerase sigma factor [Clostridia bacterium]